MLSENRGKSSQDEPIATIPAGESDVAPSFYRYHGRARRLIPRTWGAIHGWITIIFMIATFGPMFGGWATSTRLIGGWPITMGWIMAWMILETLNLIGFYFTTLRRRVAEDEPETGKEAANV
jgi:hypothetical protein